MPADPDSLFESAIAYLAGASVPRSVPQARRLLAAAAEMGNVNAALCEVALRANGSDGPSNWRSALTLLQSLASKSAAAKAQIGLLEALSLNHEGYPQKIPEGEAISRMPDVRLYRKLLSPAECAHLALSVQDIIEPSVVVDPHTGQIRADPIRTSAGAVVGPTREDLVIGAVNRRIAAISGTVLEQGESLSILHYAPGEQYRPHFDTLPNAVNQRIATAIIYLNDGYQGGETYFPRSSLSISGQIGDAILFRNILPNGDLDQHALHAGLPVIAGRKWIATRWIRAHTHDPWSVGDRN